MWLPGDDRDPVALPAHDGVDGRAPDVEVLRRRPDGEPVASEMPGHGILVCPLASETSCERLDTELGWPVRPTWRPDTGELVLVCYVADASGEAPEILVATPDPSRGSSR